MEREMWPMFVGYCWGIAATNFVLCLADPAGLKFMYMIGWYKLRIVLGLL